MKDYLREMFSYSGLYRRLAKVKKIIKAERIDFGIDKNQFVLHFEPDSGKKSKVVVWIHGGGWNAGTPYDFEYVGQSFALEGYHCVSLGYRLSPKNKYPAQIQISLDKLLANCMCWGKGENSDVCYPGVGSFLYNVAPFPEDGGAVDVENIAYTP